MIIPSELQRPAISLKGVRRRSTLIWGWLRCPSHLKMPLKNIKTHEERVQAQTKYFYSEPFGSVKSSFRKIENLQIPFRSAFIITEQSFITCRWLAWMLCDVVKQKVSLLHNWYIKGGLGEFWNNRWKSSALFENPLMPRIVYLYYYFYPGTYNQSIKYSLERLFKHL